METYQFSKLPYIPNDFPAIQEKLNEFTAKVQSAGSVEEVLETIEQFDSLSNEVGHYSTLAYIRASLDCTDQFYADAVQREGAGCATLKQAPYTKALLESPFLPELEKKFGPEYRPRLEREKRLRSFGLDLMARESELVNLYQQKKAMIRIPFQGKECSEAEMYALFESPDRQIRIDAEKATFEAFLAKKEELAPMLLELVELRQKIAEANGFDSYLDYANLSFFRRGYGEEELTSFCQQVKADLVPLLQELREEQRQELGVDKLMSYDLPVRFRDGNARPAGDAVYLTEASKKMYDGLSPEFGAFFRRMVESESLDVTSSPNKVAGMGFCTTLKKGCLPYVFGNCNGTDSDVAVFTHEIGHSWQAYLSEKQNRPEIFREMVLDAVEIPSKTMELFAYPFAEEFFGEDAEKFRKGHFREALVEIAKYCAIHETNTWLYTHPGASFEEIAAANAEIEREYEPDLDHGELEGYIEQGASLLRSMAIYSFPRYVISYSLSEMCAMKLFERMQTDPKGAWEAYEKLCTSGGSRNYPDTLRQAGLEPAYAPGSVKKTVEFAKKHLKM